MVDEVEEFVALCRSVLDDGEMTEERAYELGDWLNHHEEAAGHWPCDQLIEPLQAVWADGAANREELQRLARVLISLQDEWAPRKGAMATYYKSLGSAAAFVPPLPRAKKSLCATPPPPPLPPSGPSRRGWILATGSIALLLVAAAFFAAREMRSAHDKPAAAPSSPVVRASPVPSVQTSLAPPGIAAVHAPANPATPSPAWTVTTRQNVKAKAGRKEFTIPKGTPLKVIARTDRDLMITYKGEDLTIPASATTSAK